jgi:hypothetical protein
MLLSWLLNKARPRRRNRFVPQLMILEDRCLPSLYGTPPPPTSLYENAISMPDPTVTAAQFFFNPNSPQLPTVLWYDSSATEKTITITNTSTSMIFPFLEDGNSRTPTGKYSGTGEFDPFDPIVQEYRGYIGFSGAEGKKYMGLPPGDTITINVPLVFWDSGRLIITTDGTKSADGLGSDLLGPNPLQTPINQLNQPNPFLFHYVNAQETFIGSTFPGTANSNLLQFTPLYNLPSGILGPSAPGPQQNPKVMPSNLQVGMPVSGPGIPANTTITSLTGALPNSITLSQPTFSVGMDGNTNAPYTFQGVGGGNFGSTARFITPSLSAPGSINGWIMWYHASTAQGPNPSVPAQLTEFSIRGDYFAPVNNAGFKNLLGAELAANDFNLTNYDVSYVDSIVTPVTMEATNAWVYTPKFNQDGTLNGPTPPQAPYGWVGSADTVKGLQDALKAFASNTSANGLGSYFGGQGFPIYFNPNTSSDTKLPSGQNLFLQSPFLKSTSAFPIQKFFPDNTQFVAAQYALTDGGSGPFAIIPGGFSKNIDGSALPLPNEIELNIKAPGKTGNMADSYKIQLLETGVKAGNTYDVTSSSPSDIPPNTTVANAKPITSTYPIDPTTGLVQLSQNTITANQGNHTYTFARPVTDYAATAIMNLWYSWANYFAQNAGVSQQTFDNVPINASKPDQILLTKAQADLLRPGMGVTSTALSTTSGAGLPTGTTVLLKIDPPTMNQSMYTATLSRQATGASASFTFNPPVFNATTLAGFNDQNKTWQLLPNFAPTGATALPFAQTVYAVMATMSNSTLLAADRPLSVQLLAQVIGATISSVPTVNSSDGGKDINRQLNNQIKSVLRGVPDFTIAPYNDPAEWYPDPSVPAAGLTYNAYNLDPFVWFVHEKLGLSGYGFSIDDDTADVGANGATHLAMSVGGLKNLPNQNPWTATAFFGPVSATGTSTNNGNTTTITLPNSVLWKLVSYDAPTNTLGTLVTGAGVPPGLSVFQVFLGTPITNPTITGFLTLTGQIPTDQLGTHTYTFYGPVVSTATVTTTNPNVLTINLAPGGVTNPAAVALFNTLTAILNVPVTGGTPGNVIQVTGPDIDSSQGPVTVTKVTVSGNVVTLLLSKPLVILKDNTFTYIFGHGDPFTPPM